MPCVNNGGVVPVVLSAIYWLNFARFDHQLIDPMPSLADTADARQA